MGDAAGDTRRETRTLAQVLQSGPQRFLEAVAKAPMLRAIQLH
jgi:hypothetical protein